MNKKKYELKHHKDFHQIQLQGLKIKERSIFMTLCYKAMEQESDLLEFDVSEIAKISGYTPIKSGDNIYKYLDKTYSSLQNITIKIDKLNGIKKFILFIGFETFENTGKVHFEINKNYKYLLNQVVSPYTIQNLLEYTKLKSGYSQLIYSELKKWEKTKKIQFSIESFREKLLIPKDYRMSEIDKRIISPIKKELSLYFNNLKIEKLKTGRRITSIKFTWTEKEKIKKEKLSLIDYIEKQEKDGTGSIASKCRKIYGNNCTGGYQKDVVCKLCRLMNKNTQN